MLYTKIAFCGGVLPYITPTFEGPKWKIKKEIPGKN